MSFFIAGLQQNRLGFWDALLLATKNLIFKVDHKLVTHFLH